MVLLLIQINKLETHNVIHTMNCIETRALISAAVDDELSFLEEKQFLLHLSECNECTVEFEDAQRTKLIIRERVVRFKAPQTLINSIMQLTSFSTKEMF
jgi:predicted anti-sigma-YlaC factor YlaD